VPNTHATITGNLTRDPELRFTPAGQAVCVLSVAVNESYFDKAKNARVDQDPSFFDVQVWGELAENVAQSARKGNRVTCAGSLRQRSWESTDTTSGEVRKHSRVELRAESVALDLRFHVAEALKVERRAAA
jgi:single-strand DNA-binding protein